MVPSSAVDEGLLKINSETDTNQMIIEADSGLEKSESKRSPFETAKASKHDEYAELAREIDGVSYGSVKPFEEGA